MTMLDDGSSGRRRLKVLFFVEGFTDIRFVVGLSEVCDLFLTVPAAMYRSSGLDRRVAASGARLTVHEIPGGRLGFQMADSAIYCATWRSSTWSWPRR